MHITCKNSVGKYSRHARMALLRATGDDRRRWRHRLVSVARRRTRSTICANATVRCDSAFSLCQVYHLLHYGSIRMYAGARMYSNVWICRRHRLHRALGSGKMCVCAKSRNELISGNWLINWTMVFVCLCDAHVALQSTWATLTSMNRFPE